MEIVRFVSGLSVSIRHYYINYTILQLCCHLPLCFVLVPPNTPNIPSNSVTNSLNINPQSVDGWVVSSESCSFPSVCAKLYRDVAPGEIVKLEKYKKPKTLAIVPRPERKSI